MRVATGLAAIAILWASLAVAQPPTTPTIDPPGAVGAGLWPYKQESLVSGSARAVTGMDSVEAMFRAWADAFHALNPGAELTIEQKDLAPEERIGLGPKVDEVFGSSDRTYQDRYGYQPFRIRVCQGAYILKSHVSAIGVFVSKANPIAEIALDKLDAAYSNERRRGYPVPVTTWGQLGLGGDWADKPVHVLGFYWRDDVTTYFRDLVDLGAPFRAEYRIPGEGLERRTPAVAAELMRTLEADPDAIGYANASYATPGVKALALVDARGVRHDFALSEMMSGRYPLQRSIYIYVNRRPGQPLDPMIKAFLTFVLSRDGQALVARDHYLPLTGAMATEERAKLD